MATRADFGFPPKKRITTYGRAGKRYGAANSSPGLPTEEPPQVTGKPYTPATQASSEAPTQNSSQQASSQQPRKNASRQAVSGSTLQRRTAPLHKMGKTTREEESNPRAKKRKVGTTLLPDAAVTTDIYSPPSSPPLIASPKRSTKPNAVKVSSTRLASLSEGTSADSPMIDVANPDTPFSSKTSKTLRELSIDNATSDKVLGIPFRLGKKRPPRPSGPSKKVAETAVQGTQKAKPTIPTRRGKRLIDALAAQVEDSSEEEQMPSQETPITTRSISPAMVPDSGSPPSQTDQSKASTLHRQVSMTRKAGPRMTYSHSRTMLSEESLMDIATFADDEESQRTPAFLGFGGMRTTSNLSAFSFVDDEDDTANTGAVRSLHELRQAGANSRFSDEMEDILDRIGSPSSKPSSLRRGALLELAQKMKETDFRRQFRNHGNNGGLFKGLAKETDIFAGYAVLSILTTLLATSLSQHLILQIQSEGVSHLLQLLLDESSDISVIAKDRKQNVSRNAQGTISTIKSSILKLPIWEPASPTLLPPRTLALKALDLLMRHLTGSGSESELFSSTLTDRLFGIVSGYVNPSYWDFPTQHQSLDFYLALHLLEHQSVSAMQSSIGARWATEYLPTVAGVLGVALQRPVDKFDDLETSTLKLTLNMTNNNHETPGMFVSKGLLRDLAEAACRTFDVVNKSIMDDAFLSKVYDSLILMLGVKINFCEHYAPAAQDLMDAGDGETSPLNRLIRVFLEHHAVHADADSMEKTQLNVAFGYLAILLGHLCLHQPIRERFMSIYGKRNLEPLLESIRIFITLHRVTMAAMEGEPTSRPDANAADRLQSLVDQLVSPS
ncbi:hypothetical protein BR93DRAFT_910572 [Coniochaeta sp. PMI_546]|nr:hypothetical protein BR93DRAFT_910572 [Coniochaeta sp. PMI_546]